MAKLVHCLVHRNKRLTVRELGREIKSTETREIKKTAIADGFRLIFVNP